MSEVSEVSDVNDVNDAHSCDCLMTISTVIFSAVSYGT